MAAEQNLTGLIKKWVENLALALQVYIEEHQIQSRTELAKKVGVDERMFRAIVAGERIFSQRIDLYAEIYDKLKLREADPRQIPVFESFDARRHNLRTTKPLAWSEKQFQNWRDSKKSLLDSPSPTPSAEGTITSSLMERMSVSDQEMINKHRVLEHEFTSQFLTALLKWLDKYWKGAHTNFCTSLGLKSSWIQSMKFSGYVSGVTAAYAAVFRHTHIPEADPRRLPDKLRILPQGLVKRQARAWTDQQFDEWSKEQDALDLQVSAIPTPKPVDQTAQSELNEAPGTQNSVSHVESQIISQRSETDTVQSVEDLSEVGQAFGRSIDLLTTVIKSTIQATTADRSQSSLSEMLDRLDDQLQLMTTIVKRMDRYSSLVEGPPSVVSHNSLELSQDQAIELGRKLLVQLRAIQKGSEVERGRFVERAGQLMADLYMLTHGFAITDRHSREIYFQTLQEV